MTSSQTVCGVNYLKRKIIKKYHKNFLNTSKTSLVKLESNRGGEWYISNFQNFLKGKKKQHYSRFTDKGPSIAERINRTIGSLLKKPVLEKVMLIGYLNNHQS